MARTRKTKSKPRRLEEILVTIDLLGRQGDGVGQYGDYAVYVPNTVPGDQVRAMVSANGGAGDASLLELLVPGPDRVAPPCPYFGSCGGCRLQHVANAPYLAWKRDLVADALARDDLDPGAVADVVSIPSGTRRRVTLAARRTSAGLILGFNERKSDRIVALDECAVAAPEIVALFPALRDLLCAIILPGHLHDVAVTVLDDGIDIVLIGGSSPDLTARETMASFAERYDLARISWREKLNRPVEPIAHRRAGVLDMGGSIVSVPPGGFCQASREGEAVLALLVASAVDGHRSIADLFSGVGTFGLRLAEQGHRVIGVDGDADAISAFETAARQGSFVHRPEGRVRNLFHDPMMAAELDGFDAVVFDPPRAGAKAQASEMAASNVPVVVGVSCNPSTFARDARLLVDGGYRLERVTPVDQFVWSAQIELVGVFRR